MSHRSQTEKPVKPEGCTCDYPKIIARNMNGHDFKCPIYFEWACGIVFRESRDKHEHSDSAFWDTSEKREGCPGCLPAWSGPFRNMISSVVDLHAARDACEVLHVEVIEEKPQFDQIMVAYCCDGCGAHGAHGVEGAFREKVRVTREANRVEGSYSS